ncbi:MAG: CoA-binding protein [Chloroflexi bacterium]|nr:CoA-binding protein [Chloroflexota bacterium]
MGINLNENEEARREILVNSPVIAVVGMSNDHYYTSYDVGEYLKRVGYTVYPVNPTIEEVDGEPSYPSLRDVPEPIDIVDVFRDSRYLSQIVDEAIAAGAKTVWAQLGVHDDEAVRKALAAGLNIATNLCIRTEHERLFKGMVEG